MAYDQYGNWIPDPGIPGTAQGFGNVNAQGYINPQTGQIQGPVSYPIGSATGTWPPIAAPGAQTTNPQTASGNPGTTPQTGSSWTPYGAVTVNSTVPGAVPASQSGTTGTGTVNSQQSALQAALAQGLTGQAAIDWVQKNYPQYNQTGSGIEWVPGSGPGGGTFGVPGGYYTQNPSTGQWGFVATNPEGASNGTGSAYGTGASGSLMSGFPPFVPPTSSQFSFTAPSTNVSSLPSWAQPYTQQFTLPTAAQAAQTPGYQFTLQQGEQAVNQGAAAQGGLLTGGTLKAEDQYAQGLASTTYQQAVQNSLAAFNTNYGVYQGNQAAASSAYQQAFNNAASTFGINAGAYQQTFNNALSAYGTNFGVSNTLANNQFNWNYALAGLGMGANNALTSAGNSYGGSLAAILAGIGNANAAGTVGSNNAIQGGINTGLASLYPWLYGL